MKKIIQQMGGGWIFFITIVVMYGIVGFWDVVLLMKTLVVFWGLFQKVFPILIMVLFLMFLFNLVFDPRKIVKYLGKSSGSRGWILAIGAGIIAMGSIFIWYPLLADLKSRGMANSLIAAFLYNQAIKIQLLPFLIHYFGWSFTIVTTLYMIIFSVLNGWLIEKIVPSENIQ